MGVDIYLTGISDTVKHPFALLSAITWIEYRIFWAQPGIPERYSVIRERIFPVFGDRFGGHLILNHSVYSRVRVDDTIQETSHLDAALDALFSEGVLTRWEKEESRPDVDAHNRVVEAKERAHTGGGVTWKTRFGIVQVSIPPLLWQTGLADEQVEKQFELLMTKFVAPASKAYFDCFDRPPQAEWLVSMLIHLLLNSVCCAGPDEGLEPASRVTPPI